MNDYLERLRDGDLRLYELEDELPPDEAAEVRRKYVEEETNASLSEVGAEHDLSEARANIENPVGATRVPLGIAGHIRVEGEYAEGEHFVPMATTEGALVASTNRGCSALNDAGGATARVVKDAMTRAPVFRTDGAEGSASLVEWVEDDDHLKVLKSAADSTTDHGELLWARPYVAGDNVYVRLGYETGDAMGMNMATKATRAVAGVIEDHTDAELVALSGNMCADKKPASINAVEGRGRTVVADAIVPGETVEEVLKTTPEGIAEVNERKTLVGSARSGTLGANAHAANVLSAVYIATGQDPAQVVEGSSAYTTASVRDGDLYISVTLPAVEVGTVGGGTGLLTQREALSLLGVEGGGEPTGANAKELAEIIAGTVLAGELSLHSALASRNLADAHEELGRDEEKGD